jgi:hypothetical protein
MRLYLAACAVLAFSGAQAQSLTPRSPRSEAVMQSRTSEVTGALRADRAAGRPTDLVQLAFQWRVTSPPVSAASACFSPVK